MPFSELTWARREIKESAEVGAAPLTPQEVVKVGDLVYVEAIDNRGNYGLRQVPEVNGAIVAMDPHTGRVLALSGGFSYASSQFDRAMQAMRQPGSAFKPFVYAAALDNGFTPVSKVLDAPFVIEQGPGLPLWHPENFEKKFIGLATLRRGIELSKNLMTVRLAQAVGMDKVEPYPERFGVYDHLPPLLANALGSAETTLLRLTTGYSEFDNGGKKVTPSLVDRIQDRTGKTIWRHDDRRCDGCNSPNWQGQSEPLLDDTRDQIIDTRTAYQIVSMLQGVVERGTGRSIAVIGKPLAGKTGTSERIQRRLVRRLLAGFGLRRVRRLRQSPHPGQARTRRHRRRADLPRFHEGRLGRCSGDAVPRAAGYRIRLGRSHHGRARSGGVAHGDRRGVQSRDRAGRSGRAAATGRGRR